MAPRSVPGFAVTTSVEGAATVITVTGELDIGSATTLRDTLLKLITDEVPDVAIEASGLTFVDSSGLAVLLMAARRWTDAGRSLVLRRPSRTLLRLVDLTGARQAFVIDEGP